MYAVILICSKYGEHPKVAQREEGQMNKQYVRNLESIIKQMMTPLKNIPLNLVIECLSGCRIIPFNKKKKEDLKVLGDLKKVAKIAGRVINKEGIQSRRANEVGNNIEQYVKDAINSIGYKADIPIATNGIHKAVGYPDIEFTTKQGKVYYLECKTYNQENIYSTLRSFYISPSDNFKITKPAQHFVITFEVYVAGKKRDVNIYRLKGWKILSIENLLVDVKYEFNSDNLRLYSEEHILASGSY